MFEYFLVKAFSSNKKSPVFQHKNILTIDEEERIKENNENKDKKPRKPRKYKETEIFEMNKKKKKKY